MATVLWGPEIAAVYDATSADMFAPAVLRPTVDVLAALAGGGAALEFAAGTGRVAPRRAVAPQFRAVPLRLAVRA